ncbi:MAG: HAD family hydrolase [Eggerthellaceae bacterium]|nr:HAD family hydrolase [Eggerthellaceae bacterium]
MQTGKRSYRAICFDLDGTLLPMDLELFMNGYFGSLARFAATKGLEVEQFLKGLKAGTKAMAVSGEDVVNADAFWNTMLGYLEDPERDWVSVFEEFYLSDFKHVGDGVIANPAAAKAVASLKEKGYTLALTTMPMFPELAVAERLRWAGVDANAFARITTYENSRSVKPRQTYYAENLAALGVRGEDVLMVGNNTVEDLAFLDLGADGYVVTDHLIDPVDYDFETIKHGSMEEFAAWVETLPVCSNPAQNVITGVIDPAAMQAALEANAVVDIDLEEAVRKAAAAIDDPTYESAKGGRSKAAELFGEGVAVEKTKLDETAAAGEEAGSNEEANA